MRNESPPRRPGDLQSRIRSGDRQSTPATAPRTITSCRVSSQRRCGQFGRHPRAGVCVAFGSCTEGDGGPLIVNDPGWCDRPTYFTPEELCRRLWHTLPVSAIIVRRDAAMAAGGYRPELAWYSDWFAFLVVAFRHGVIHLPETLGVHVLHPNSYPANARTGPENIRVLGALLDLLDCRPSTRTSPRTSAATVPRATSARTCSAPRRCERTATNRASSGSSPALPRGVRSSSRKTTIPRFANSPRSSFRTRGGN